MNTKILWAPFVFALLTTTLHTPKLKKDKFISLDWNRAFAQTILDGSVDFTTPEGQANFIRYQYYSVNGPTGEYSLSNDQMGYMQMLNSIIGSLGEGMGELGYETCGAIPTTGTEVVEGFDVTFSTGTKTIPSHFGSDAGETFEKRIEVTKNGALFMHAQLSCSDSSTVTSGYFLIPKDAPSADGQEGSTDGFGFETYYQKDTATGAAFADFYLQVTSMNLRIGIRFSAPDADSYSLYSMTFYQGTGNAIAISGEPNGITAVNMINTYDMNGALGTANIWGDLSSLGAGAVSGCLDLSTNTTATGCSSIPNPGTFTTGATYQFTLNSFKDMEISDS